MDRGRIRTVFDKFEQRGKLFCVGFRKVGAQKIIKQRGF